MECIRGVFQGLVISRQKAIHVLVIIIFKTGVHALVIGDIAKF